MSIPVAVFELLTVTDGLRLVALPVFAWAAIRDVRTRRVPNVTWYPLIGLGVLLLVWDGLRVVEVGGLTSRLFAIRVGLSLIVIAPAGYLFYRLGAFGGADAKALGTIAVLFPTFPTYWVFGVPLPYEVTPIGVFSLTVLTNTVLVGIAYPAWLTCRNAVSGRIAPAMVVGRPVPWSAVETTHGRLLPPGGGLEMRGLDLDALRIYLQWRGVTLSDVRSAPERYRDPATLPEEPHPVGDGAVATDGGEGPTATEYDDPWGAAAFVDDVGPVYGTTPETLRRGLDQVTSAEQVWVSPGIPFIVPMFLGLVIAMTWGDLLYTVFRALGVG